MDIIKSIFTLLQPNEKFRCFILLALLTIAAVIDTLGVAAIYPFILVLTDPLVIETNYYLNNFFNFTRMFGVENQNDFLSLLGFIIFFIIITSSIIKALNSYLSTKIILSIELRLTKSVLVSYLYKPYSWILDKHTSQLQKNILSDVANVIGNILNPLVELISKSLIAIMMIAMLVKVEPGPTLIVILVICFYYVTIFKILNNFITNIGKKAFENNNFRFRAISEIFNSFKYIKIANLENSFITKCVIPTTIYYKNIVNINVLTQLPKHIFEAIVFGSLLFFIINKIQFSYDLNKFLPTIGTIIFAGYRIIPCIHQIYSSFTKFKFSNSAIKNLMDDILNSNQIENKNYNKRSVMSFNKLIKLKNVFFNYENSKKSVINNLNLEIPVKSMIAITGPSGCGKSTLIDILTGLLTPKNGELTIDDVIITKKNLRLWQNSIGYVPQNIYLSDDTIASNIAFGLDNKDIDYKRVENSAKIAQIHDLIKNELPKKYLTKIGERGVRLSGGQRQRLGLARALYYNPKLLILDEATNALDFKTEQKIMDTLYSLNDITIIVISHRFDTIKNCDIIIKFKNGQITSEKNNHIN